MLGLSVVAGHHGPVILATGAGPEALLDQGGSIRNDPATIAAAQMPR
jgi:hypothetical protein